ncbi:hypothetical protein [Paenibacillus kandeliae]|uniref:hypothetical protein n=1 Tax=Paenibacillus kandeliae TaxID=3231269 RepID=UPI00345ADD90
MYMLIFLIGSIIWFIYFILMMSAIKKKTSKVKSRSIIMIVAFLFGIIGLAGSISELPSQNNDLVEAATKIPSNDSEEANNIPQEQVEINNSLGLTTDQFLNKYNGYVKDNNLSNHYIISNLNVEKGKANLDIFNHQLAENLIVSGGINKADSSLSFVQFFLGKSDSTDYVSDLAIMLFLLTNSIDSDLSTEQAHDLNSQVINHFSQSTESLVLYENGFEYKTSILNNGIVYKITKPST